jgi:hypothetical protein
MRQRFSISRFLQSRYKSILLVVLVALFLTQRGGLLLFGYSHIAHPSFDETASGVLACDLLDGKIRAPLFVYQYESRSGDGLIEGLLLVPLFKLFGRSLFSLKILALLSSFLSLICWIILVARCQGMWAAIVFTSLFAFPPLMFARLNLMGTIASHHLINPLIAVQLLFFFQILKRKRAKAALWLWLGFGFLSGLGAYTFYTYIIFNAFCLLFLLIFKLESFTWRRILLFTGGLFAGFSPWILRSIYSRAGGSYLAAILEDIGINLWKLIQNFCFNLPHSFGYQYPSREMGIVSPLFLLCIIFLAGVIVRSLAGNWHSLRVGSLRSRLVNIPLPTQQGMFFILFPLFYLVCLSLSPMTIRPFEYWPTVGFFGNFSTADVYRYRWLHLLFPFYFAIIAVGISLLFTTLCNNKAYKPVALLLLGFFLLWGLGKSVTLCSKNDFCKIFYYKGYSYDRMGNRFILGDANQLSMEEAQQLAAHYPRENRIEAYRCLGTKVTLALRNDSQGDKKLERSLKEIQPSYVNDFIFGVVRAAQNITEEKFHPFGSTVAKTFPALFYTNWGFRHLGHTYYASLLNREKIMSFLPPLEKWFFRNFLKGFSQQLYSRESGKRELLNEIDRLPIRHQADVVKGVGMLVGAEMFFDSLLSPDYPLDSRWGEMLESNLQEAFYEGLGGGFAETFCRFLRKLLLPDNPDLPLYEKIVDIEWERCHVFMSKIAPSHSVLIKRGFVMEIERRYLDTGIRKYLRDKLR